MLGVVFLSLASFLALSLVLILLLCFLVCCCKICRRTKKPSPRRDVERGLENTQQDGRCSEDGLTSSSISTLYRRITEPEIKNGKLYGQDYFAIKERLDRTQTLFLDDKVTVWAAINILIIPFSSLRTNIPSATTGK